MTTAADYVADHNAGRHRGNPHDRCLLCPRLRVIDATADPAHPDVRVVPESLSAEECDWPGHTEAMETEGFCPVCQQ